MLKMVSIHPIVAMLLVFAASACVPAQPQSSQQEVQLQATVSALETRIAQQEARITPSTSEQQLQATVSALQTQLAQQITPSVTMAVSPTASGVHLNAEVTPSPTLTSDTSPDSILEVGESWRQGGLMLTLVSFSFVTDDAKWSYNEPLGILTVWKIANKGTTPVLVTFRSAEQFSARDNLGRSLQIEGFRTGLNTCAAFVDCDVTFALEPGQSRHLSCGRDDCPPGLKIDVDLSDPEVTEVIITVNIGTIKDARWRVKIRAEAKSEPTPERTRVAREKNPETTRPPSPEEYCWNTTGSIHGPTEPPTPFLYQPFEGSLSVDSWASQMDHAQPTYRQNGKIATLGELLQYDTHRPGLASGTVVYPGYRHFPYDVPYTEVVKKGYYVLAYQSPSFEYYLFYDGHDGHDFAVSGNALAAADGKVVFKGNNGLLGRVIEIYHSQGYLTRYAHLASFEDGVEAGETEVRAGDPIGEIGGSAVVGGKLEDNYWGVHLHFTVFRWSEERGAWQITDPFGWDPWAGPDQQRRQQKQREDPLVQCNGEVSYPLWVGEWPQPYSEVSITAAPAAESFRPTQDRYVGGWLGEQPALQHLVEVRADLDWQDTGVFVQLGQRLEISAEGIWTHGLDDPVRPNPYGPEGTNKFEPQAILPSARIGALIGRIGTGTPFLVGKYTSLMAETEGQLQLVMNEHPPLWGNNEGSVFVEIVVEEE